MIALEYCMFVETLKEIWKADSETSYNLSMKLLAEGRCSIPQQRFNNFQSLEGRKQWHPNMVFLWGPEMRNTGLQLYEIVHGMEGIWFCRFTTYYYIKNLFRFLKKSSKEQVSMQPLYKSFVTCVFSSIDMYIRYAYINKWTSELQHWNTHTDLYVDKHMNVYRYVHTVNTSKLTIPMSM